MKVAIFVPCFIDQLFPQTAVNMVQLLRRLGCEVSYNPQQTCCGQPAFNAGFWAEAKGVGEKWLQDFAAFSAMPIICPSASCVGFLRNYFRQWVEEDANQAFKHRDLFDNIYELSEFLSKKIPIQQISARFPAKVAYHHSCSALNECKNRDYALQLLAQVQDLQLVTVPDAEVCCGFGGTFAVKFEPISVAMAEKKVESALAAGADYFVSTDLSCLMHLEGYIKNKNLPIKVAHLADVLCGV